MSVLKQAASAVAACALGVAAFVMLSPSPVSAKPNRKAVPTSLAAPKSPAIGEAAQARLIRAEAEQARAYRGTTVKPSKSVLGDGSERAEEIARLLTRRDFVPGDRDASFAWVRALRADVVEWRGEVIRVDQADEGLVAQVKFTPVNTSGTRVIHGDVVESYGFNGWNLRYLGYTPNESECRVVSF